MVVHDLFEDTLDVLVNIRDHSQGFIVTLPPALMPQVLAQLEGLSLSVRMARYEVDLMRAADELMEWIESVPELCAVLTPMRANHHERQHSRQSQIRYASGMVQDISQTQRTEQHRKIFLRLLMECRENLQIAIQNQ